MRVSFKYVGFEDEIAFDDAVIEMPGAPRVGEHVVLHDVSYTVKVVYWDPHHADHDVMVRLI
ncbi:MAG TPA: hypothetical protein VK735_40010 [Pseudonocardia sp.]|uniref:hypothetical protein n=1 Tax=Pseudonocardia sp. TaxID=60912 RepID=UPI002CFDA5B7|nr:hypothetical protein [Pseudonocardia sp.]HTF53670.1 hypothetical protein [Pseudonocardia sp.]